jgi:hypothetical protein
MVIRLVTFICKQFLASLCNNVKKKLCRGVSFVCVCRLCVVGKAGCFLCRIVSRGETAWLPLGLPVESRALGQMRAKIALLA